MFLTFIQNNAAPKYHFGLKNSQSMSQLNPGPGQYNINRNLGHIAYVFGLKPDLNNSHKIVPGPGAYQHAGSFQNIPGSKIGTSRRDDDF
jgi:hypothetical protein